MDNSRILMKAAEMFNLSPDMIERIWDVETLSEDEAYEEYGDELYDIEAEAEKLPLDWYKQAKQALMRKIQITENDIRYMAQQAICEAYGQGLIDEGKLGKALGTAALGGALIFGGPKGNAQEMPQRDTTMTQQIMQPSDSLSKQPSDTLQIQPNQQAEKYVFKAVQFEKDYQTILSLKKSLNGYHKQWAQELMKRFPVDKNGAIHLEYIIVCNQNFDRQKAMETSVDWFNYAFSNASAIKQCDYDNGIITASGRYTNIAQYNVNAIYYVKTVSVSADTDIVIRFKENRIKIDVMVRSYHIISGDSLLQAKNSLVSVSDAFPINDASDNKMAYARAFINSYAYSFDKVNKYIDFMNKNMTSPFDTSNDDW